jgi:predicted O-methyltransferase YrrM
MSEDELLWLHARASEMNSIVEVGSYKGRSTYALATGCKGTVYAIDHWEGQIGVPGGEDVYQEFLRNMAGVPNLKVIKSDSVNASATFEPVDMVFLDGGHTYQDVVNDIRAWKPKAKKLLCGHDYDFHEVARAVKEYLGHVKLAGSSIWYIEIK